MSEFIIGQWALLSRFGADLALIVNSRQFGNFGTSEAFVRLADPLPGTSRSNGLSARRADFPSEQDAQDFGSAGYCGGRPGIKNSRSAGRRADRAKMAAKEFFFG
ncbi:hypothetical protein N2603_39320 [Bradyrhizobium huanghuaihaiense]|uniref:hypothetical protein n=1 Tax=Bradyrhizobium huanghuaihaiense TaxID=990078 RepID=UPI0021AAB2C5|nr:hypothetical protein [Bradyrhizobium sp. CB3035]UWU75928.1 hypothetical protein N2603_39320 [Bradyrhizobium sp. CB3035]